MIKRMCVWGLTSVCPHVGMNKVHEWPETKSLREEEKLLLLSRCHYEEDGKAKAGQIKKIFASNDLPIYDLQMKDDLAEKRWKTNKQSILLLVKSI
jgi:hypothetical protein